MKSVLAVFIVSIFYTNIFAQEDVIQPLAVGYNWDYESSYGELPDTVRLEISGSTFIEFQDSTIEAYYWEWSTSGFKWLAGNRDDGFWFYGHGTPSDSVYDAELTIKYPTFVGDIYINNKTLMGDTALVACIATDSIVNTPIGPISCYVYYAQLINRFPAKRSNTGFLSVMMNHPNNTSKTSELIDGRYLFFSPGIGYVQLQTVEDSIPNIELTLLSYDLDMPTALSKMDYTANNFSLNQNFPNPFNPSTTIKYHLNKISDIRLSVYDISGREVKSFSVKNQREGEHVFNFEASNISSGVYIYTLKAGNFEQSRKMILMK